MFGTFTTQLQVTYMVYVSAPATPNTVALVISL